MKDGFAIRPANNLDTSFIQATVHVVLNEYGLKFDKDGKDADLNNIQENYFDAGGFFGIVDDVQRESSIGTFGVFKIDGDVCELRKMYLMKDVRGKGCGKMILNFAIDWARNNNYKKIRLETMGVLKEAIALYKLYGFSETSPRTVNDRVDQAFELELF